MLLGGLLTNVTKFSHAEIRPFENTLYRSKSDKQKRGSRVWQLKN